MSRGGGVSGRGAILRMLEADDNETLSSGDTTQIGQITSDSGLGTTRSVGRGRIVFDTTDDADDSAKALSISRSGSSMISDGTSGDGLKLQQKPTSGRGKILQAFRDEPTISSIPVSTKPEEKMDTVAEHVKSMKIDTEMEPVIRHGTKG